MGEASRRLLRRSLALTALPILGLVLPRTGIALNLPAERLYHVDGMPREAFRPKVQVDVAQPRADPDPFLAAALRVLTRP